MPGLPGLPGLPGSSQSCRQGGSVCSGCRVAHHKINTHPGVLRSRGKGRQGRRFHFWWMGLSQSHTSGPGGESRYKPDRWGANGQDPCVPSLSTMEWFDADFDPKRERRSHAPPRPLLGTFAMPWAPQPQIAPPRPKKPPAALQGRPQARLSRSNLGPFADADFDAKRAAR